MKGRGIAIALLLFILVYCLVYYVHISYFRVGVVLYSAVFDGMISTLITAILLSTAKYFKRYNSLEKSLLIVVMFLLSIVISISVPTIIDRSLSFYILEKIQQHGGSVKLSSMEHIFTEEYIVEHRLIDIRLTEQIESGTIIVKDDCVLLTPTGDSLSTMSRFFRKNLLPKKRLIRGEYTDDLTDPFRNGLRDYHYQCNNQSNTL